MTGSLLVDVLNSMALLQNMYHSLWGYPQYIVACQGSGVSSESHLPSLQANTWAKNFNNLVPTNAIAKYPCVQPQMQLKQYVEQH